MLSLAIGDLILRSVSGEGPASELSASIPPSGIAWRIGFCQFWDCKDDESSIHNADLFLIQYVYDKCQGKPPLAWGNADAFPGERLSQNSLLGLKS